jgi:MFS family permease
VTPTGPRHRRFRLPAPLRRRGFGLLWAGYLVSDLGDWTLLIGLPVIVFQLTGSALTTSTVFVVELVTGLVAGQVGGVLVDRFDRRRILVLASLLQALLLLPLLAVDSPDRLWIVYLVAAGQSALARICAPAQASLVPVLVPPQELAQANGLAALAGSLARLLGAPLGGLVVAALGLAGIVAVDAVTFLAAAALLASIPARELRKVEASTAAPTTIADGLPTADHTLRRFVADWVDGWRTIVRVPGLGALVGIGAASQVAQGIFVVLYVVFVLQVLGADGGAVGLIRGLQAIGGIAAGLVIGAIAARLGTRNLVGWGFVLFGVLSFAIWNAVIVTTAVPVYATLFALVGFPAVAVMVGLTTAIQTLSPPSHLGRVYAAYDTSSTALQAVGVLAAGALADRIGVAPILDVQALIYVTCGLVALWLLREPRGSRAARPEPVRP